MSLPDEWMPCLALTALLALEAGLVVGAAAAIERCTRSALWHRAIWQAATVGLLLLAVLEVSGISRELAALIRTVPPLVLVRHGSPASPAIPAAGRDAPRLTDEFRSRVDQRVTLNRGNVMNDSSLRRIAGRASSPLEAPLSREALPEQEPTEPFLQGHSMPWPELIWVLGTGAALGTIWLARLFFFFFQRNRRGVSDGALLERIATLARGVGIHRRVRDIESDRLPGPVAFGLLRPTIGLPKDFARIFSTGQQDVMLAHELAHLSGHDPAWHMLADLVASVLWWHPLAWWARHRLRAAAEAAADGASLLVTDGPGLLAECLLHLASRVVGGQSLGGLGVAGTGFRSGLGRRIERLVRLRGGSWVPLRRIHSGTVNLVVPIALVAAAILCTAWAGPRKHGEPMKTIRQTWKRSVATVALFAAFGAEQGQSQVPAGNAPANPAAAPAAQADPAGGGPAPEAPAEVTVGQNSPQEQPANSMPEEMLRRYGLGGATQNTNAAEPYSRHQMDPRLMERYGLVQGRSGIQTAGSPTPRPSRGKQQVEAQLDEIMFNDDWYDGLPLSEVVRDLNEQSLKRDPSKRGINFRISNVPESPLPTGNIDPTTGQPIVVPTVDLSNVIIRLHLRNVRLKDVLDAMTRVTDLPIKYSVEDYGVVFSPGSGAGSGYRAVEPPRLKVRTFRVDTNTFLAGLESAFGIVVPHTETTAPSSLAEKTAAIMVAKAEEDFNRAEQLHAQHTVSEQDLSRAKYDLELAKAQLEAARAKETSNRTASPRDTQQALKQLLRQFGINLEVPKAVFYNDLTGIVMVRATSADLDLVQAAIETLGGTALSQVAGAEPAGTGSGELNSMYRQRYGIGQRSGLPAARY